MIISMVGIAPCAWWVCWPSASSNDRYYGERLEERGGLSIIGVEDRVYADLYKGAIADEYVNEAWGSPKAEGRGKNVEMAAVYCRKKDTTTDLYRNNGNAEKKNYIRGMEFAMYGTCFGGCSMGKEVSREDRPVPIECEEGTWVMGCLATASPSRPTHGTLPELATSAPSGPPRRREHIEHRTDGRGPGITALQGAGENSLQPAEIYDLGADLVQMDSCQRLNLGARCSARFGENEQFPDLADGKADLARATDKR
jgi:hypothetical protein